MEFGRRKHGMEKQRRTGGSHFIYFQSLHWPFIPPRGTQAHGTTDSTDYYYPASFPNQVLGNTPNDHPTERGGFFFLLYLTGSMGHIRETFEFHIATSSFLHAISSARSCTTSPSSLSKSKPSCLRRSPRHTDRIVTGSC